MIPVLKKDFRKPALILKNLYNYNTHHSVDKKTRIVYQIGTVFLGFLILILVGVMIIYLCSS